MKPERRTQILDYIQTYQREHLVSPTYRQIADALGIRSTGTIHHHIHSLKADGTLDRPRRGRSRRLVTSEVADEGIAEAISASQELALWRDTAARVSAERDRLAARLQVARQGEAAALARERELIAKTRAQAARIRELEENERQLRAVAAVRTLRDPAPGRRTTG